MSLYNKQYDENYGGASVKQLLEINFELDDFRTYSNGSVDDMMIADCDSYSQNCVVRITSS